MRPRVRLIHFELFSRLAARDYTYFKMTMWAQVADESCTKTIILPTQIKPTQIWGNRALKKCPIKRNFEIYGDRSSRSTVKSAKIYLFFYLDNCNYHPLQRTRDRAELIETHFGRMATAKLQSQHIHMARVQTLQMFKTQLAQNIYIRCNCNVGHIT